MKAYLTLLGRSIWALINSYYAVVEERGYHPEKVIVYAEGSGETQNVVDAIKIISGEYGFSPSVEAKIVHEGDFIASGNTISADVKKLRELGYETALDITPGRKPLVAGAILTASKHSVDHIYYLNIDSTKDADRPYLLIPRKRQVLTDFAEEARRL